MTTNVDLVKVLEERNKEGKYNALIERAQLGGYHDCLFDRVEGHPEYGDTFPKIQLVQDLTCFPELVNIRQAVIDGDYDEEASEEDIEEMKGYLIDDHAPDKLFDILGFDAPTYEERKQRKMED